MDIQEISNLISNVGFPIVCVIILWKQTQDQTAKHKEEMDKLAESVHNNTIALTELTTLIKNWRSKE